MPGQAAVALAQEVCRREEEVLAVNGSRPAAEAFAAEVVRLAGGTATVSENMRLHELGELVPPAAVPGQLRAASEDDVELALEWYAAFSGDADEQAGRPRGSSAHHLPGREDMLAQIRAGDVWFWVDEAGERVHLTAVRGPAFGVARVGPVYTPPEQRGRGWASNAVAAVSGKLQAGGARVCLYTDQANPTSNKIYAALGYRPVTDTVNLTITR